MCWYYVSYLEEYGFSPTISKCTACLKLEYFDHKTKEYSYNVDGIGEIK